MGKISPNKRQANGLVSKFASEMIDARADALTLTRGKYCALIFAKWEADGFPAVTKADENLRLQVIADLNQKKSAEKKKGATNSSGIFTREEELSEGEVKPAPSRRTQGQVEELNREQIAQDAARNRQRAKGRRHSQNLKKKPPAS